jgi:hypothetical protein
MTSQLLCTFSTKEELDHTLQTIYNTYTIVYNYIYILQNKTNLNELFITYNIDNQDGNVFPMENTILIHRKKITNTIYTINALNELIREENGGSLDIYYQLDWENLQNCIILTGSDGIRKIPTRVLDVITIGNNNG